MFEYCHRRTNITVTTTPPTISITLLRMNAARTAETITDATTTTKTRKRKSIIRKRFNYGTSAATQPGMFTIQANRQDQAVDLLHTNKGS